MPLTHLKSTTGWIKTPLSIQFLLVIAVLSIPAGIILGIFILVTNGTTEVTLTFTDITRTELNPAGIAWGISAAIGGIINWALLSVICNIAKNIHITRVYTQLRFELETTEENLTEIENNYKPL